MTGLSAPPARSGQTIAADRAAPRPDDVDAAENAEDAAAPSTTAASIETITIDLRTMIDYARARGSEN
jgi:hypothetical protein